MPLFRKPILPRFGTFRLIGSPFPNLPHAHTPIWHPMNRDPCPAAQPRTNLSEIGCGSARPFQRLEHRSADRSSACENGRQSCGTCPAARHVDGDKRAAEPCSVYYRIRHRQLNCPGRNRWRRSVFVVIRIKKEINSASRALLVSSPFPFPPVLRGACNLREPQRMQDRVLFG